MNAWRVVAAVLVAGVAAALLSAFGPKPQYTPDGYDYAIVMLMDRGVPYASAQGQAERFFARQPDAKNPLLAPWLRGKPEYWELFSVRRLYPWLASLLYPLRGFAALSDVSRASYVATAMLVVLLAARFAPLPAGVLLSVVLSLFPAWRDIGCDALTDALAVALTTATLLAAAACVTTFALWRLAVFALLCALLSFTRPIAYIVLGAAIVAGALAPRTGDRKRLVAAAAMTGVAALCCLALEIALERAHAPSIGWIVADTYAHFVAAGYAPAGESLSRFYLGEEWTIAWHSALRGLLYVVPALAVAGFFLRRRNAAAPLLGGACAATWLGALVDPSRFDVIRCIVMPVAPVMAAFAAAAVADLGTRVPSTMGLPAQALRHFIPRRALVRNTTVKE